MIKNVYQGKLGLFFVANYIFYSKNYLIHVNKRQGIQSIRTMKLAPKIMPRNSSNIYLLIAHKRTGTCPMPRINPLISKHASTNGRRCFFFFSFEKHEATDILIFLYRYIYFWWFFSSKKRHQF
jgi:hypothetical protein